MDESQFKRHLSEYSRLAPTGTRIKIKPVLDEEKQGSDIDGHYYYMNAWMYDKILERKPKEHIDFGGPLNLLELLARHTKIKYYDIQSPSPAESKIDFNVGSVTDPIFESDSIESLSCLHVAEHVGLGRYGDALDPDGTQKACKNLARMLKPGGNLYFAVPVGREETQFNANRILSPRSILEWFKGLNLVELCASHVFPDTAPWKESNYFKNMDISDTRLTNAYYACGMFHFQKA